VDTLGMTPTLVNGLPVSESHVDLPVGQPIDGLPIGKPPIGKLHINGLLINRPPIDLHVDGPHVGKPPIGGLLISQTHVDQLSIGQPHVIVVPPWHVAIAKLQELPACPPID